GGELKEREEHRSRPFMSHQQSAKGAEPSNRPLNDPAVAIDPQPAPILVRTMNAILPVGTDQGDAAGRQAFAERVAVVGAVADQAMGRTPAGRYPRGERLVDERDLSRRGRGEAYSQRNTLTLHQYHALCTFPPAWSGRCRSPLFRRGKG